MILSFKRFKNLFKPPEDKRIWKESFRSFKDGKLDSITYFCPATKEFKKSTDQLVERKWWTTVGWESKHTPDRVKYAKDILQPFKTDGTVNPDYVKAYKRDPRQDESHRNNPRNINNNYAGQNFEANQEFRKWERKKYNI